MTNEQIQLLVKDLSARLPYGVKCFIEDDYAPSRNGVLYEIDMSDFSCGFEDTGVGQGYWYTKVDNVKPYLRPMSSMTDDEKKKAQMYLIEIHDWGSPAYAMAEYVEWLNSIHVDYRNWIEQGLALPAPEGMY